MIRSVTRRIGAGSFVLAATVLLLVSPAAASPLGAQEASDSTSASEGVPSGAGAATAARPDSAPPVERRARDIQRLFRPDPGGYETVFAPSFLGQVPAETLHGIFAEYHAEHARATAVEVIGPFAGGVTVIRLAFEDGTAALLQLAVEPTEPHRVTGALIGPSFSFQTNASGASRGKVEVHEPAYASDEYHPRTRLRLPFEGEWWVFWGGRTQEANYHRASALQRYAYDFVVRKDGSTHAGDGRRNDEYWCEGRPILAPAAGAIVAAKDGVAENVPRALDSDEKLGNHVVIDHGNGEFSLLAHLQTGSIAVEPGDEVEAGDRVGACGNSGNSTEPHLHYQLQTGPDFFEAEALPAPFHDYRADGVIVEIGEPVRGQTIEPLTRATAEPAPGSADTP